MTRRQDEYPAEEQFPVVDPALIREALRVLKLPRGHRPGSTAATVTVELTALQVNYLLMRARQRPCKLEGNDALKREIESLISADISEGLRTMHESLHPWLHIIQMARAAPAARRLRAFLSRGRDQTKPKGNG